MKKIFLLMATIIFLTSCASIISGTHQSVLISSSPSDATIYDNGLQIGKTPISARLERKRDHAISIKLDGYEPYQILIKREFNEWYLGNILFGGIIGLVIDPITGALYKLTPKQINVELNTATAVQYYKKEGDMHIFISLKKNPEWQQIGQLVAVK
ncbi:MAG: PEGA domain-containing protein [Prevotellaceae bacterium]|nr:PEGA domain-containing protein [Prevotellaceae bacterium]